MGGGDQPLEELEEFLSPVVILLCFISVSTSKIMTVDEGKQMSGLLTKWVGIRKARGCLFSEIMVADALVKLIVAKGLDNAMLS
ncbi:hypothetical protein R6Q59_022895 [Mikania micrantha]